MEATANMLSIPDIEDIEDTPNQPVQFNFPKRDFGKKKTVSRAFQSSWFVKWKWLHYDAARDLAFCHTCVYAVKTGKIKITGNAKDSAFLCSGYSNWKDATVSFVNHEKTLIHKTAVDVVVTLPKTTRNVGEMLASSYATEKANNRHCLMAIARNIQFLSRQGIALCGDGDEKDSNFIQLLLLRASDDPHILPWLERKTNKYTSPEIQNELLGIMAKALLREIAVSIKKAKFYTLMADEVTDASNIEQVAICLRSVDERLEPHEDFIGLHSVDSIKADTLVAVLKDVLLRLDLPMSDCRDQCYDGAANMAGAKNGVSSQIIKEEPRATFTHCYGHALNLAAGDTIKKNKILRNALDTTFEISKLLKYSPRFYTKSKRSGFEKREKRRTIRFLQEAIEQNNVEKVKEYLLADFDVDFQYKEKTALQLAVDKGHVDICKLLIEKGANVNKSDAEENNLLHMACCRRYPDIAHLLILHGADVDARNDSGFTCLNSSALLGYSDIAHILISVKCDLDIPSSRLQTPLHTAVNQGNSELVKLYVDSGCDVNRVDDNKRAPLHIAALSALSDITEILIAGGANVDLQDRYGNTAVFEAAVGGHYDVAEILITNNADLNISTSKGYTALIESIRQNRIAVASLLIDSGCDVNKPDRLSQAPIHCAVRQVSQYFGPETEVATCIDLVKKLIKSGCDLNNGDNQGWRPLYQSAFAGDLETTKLLLDSQVDVTVVTKTGDTVLHGGVYGNQPEVVDLLIQHGCGINDRNEAGEHALFSAVSSRAKIQIVEALIKADSDVNLTESSKAHTPLHAAIHQSNTEAALILMEAGCDINIKDTNQHNPIYMACEKGNEDVLAWLLHQSSIKLHEDDNSVVPLHIAALKGHAAIVEMLVKAGCHINQLNDHGVSALQISTMENKSRVTTTLLQFGCDLNAHVNISQPLTCCDQHDDAHPHFDLEPLFLAMTHKNVELMTLFVQCYRHVPHRVIRLLGNILKNTRDLDRQYGPQIKREIFTLFLHALSVPRSLQEICRAEICYILGSKLQMKVSDLPLASKLKDFVLKTSLFASSILSPRDKEEISHW